MRKTVLVAFVLLTCLASAAGAQIAIVQLTSANESPGPGAPGGVGLAGLRIEGTTISFTIMVQGIATPTASHIHRGAAGVAGPIVVTLSPSFPNNVATGTASASADLIDEIRRNPGGFYVNVHNAAFPNGAIRGQLTPGVFSVLTGANEFPGPGDPDGFGMAVFFNGPGGGSPITRSWCRESGLRTLRTSTAVRPAWPARSSSRSPARFRTTWRRGASPPVRRCRARSSGILSTST